jgi:two-component system, chemotaxis family, CheB/CheR fusion protein
MAKETPETSTSDSREQSPKETDDRFLVAGLGASAGGIQALKEFFSRVPEDSGIAYVVILHMSPEHESKLAEILQTTSPIPVTQVRDRVRIEPNHAYVIPPNQSLAIKHGHLSLSPMTGMEERRSPVDNFFRTLAEANRELAVSVILSGTGANGSLGVKRVKEYGGVAIAQDPKEAEYPDMPNHAIATTLVDYVLPVAEIPAKIISYKDHLGTLQIPVEPEERQPTDDEALANIFAQLKLRTGHDFSNYKRSTVIRRIERRMGVREVANLQDYASFLRENAEEAQMLLKDLLISVTNYFRDTESIHLLAREVLPKTFEGKQASDQVRVWVPGCATGEEAYSIAMLLDEFAAGSTDARGFQLFATDIDENAIAIARDGFYSDAEISDVSPERLRRFFHKEDRGYRVRRDLREKILFAVHNLIKDPPFSHVDLVSCRNLLIYLNRAAQTRALEVLHFALNPGGYLFLGSSESVDGATDLFASFNKEHHIYQSRPVPPRSTFEIPSFPVIREIDRPDKPELVQEARALRRMSYSQLHLRLLEQYGPPSVVVNEEFDIVHLSEKAGRYLQMPGGEPSHNLLEIVRPELRLDLRTALYEATQNRTAAEARGLRVRVNDHTETINLLVRPVLRRTDGTEGFLLVLFEGAPEDDATPAAEVVRSGEPITRRLEQELVESKARVRAVVQQYEVQQEELRASNEELQSMNEELRSAAEELETGKEELQSTNEELSTVNQELKIKIEELSQANSDFKNLMNSTDIGTIFLDRSLNVKLFTPRARDIFNLIATDTGRSLSDITSKLKDEDLIPGVKHVLGSLQRIEREVQTTDGRWYMMGASPYRTTDDHIEGVVITFVDITERKQTELANRRLVAIVESSADAIISQDLEGVITAWNKAAERVFGFSKEEAIGQPISIISPSDQPQEESKIAERIKGGERIDEYETVRRHKSGKLIDVSLTLYAVRDEGGRITGISTIARDLSEGKRLRLESEAKLAEAKKALQNEITDREHSEELRMQVLGELIKAQEDERRRIARDLHDQLGQQLTALRLKLETLKGQAGDRRQLEAGIEDLQALTKSLDLDVEFLAWELRPTTLDDLGLVAALRNYVKEWSERFHIIAEFHDTGMIDMRLPPEIESNLYRIAQEALNNVAKHAQAATANVLLERRDSEMSLIIEDDGVGFDSEADRSHGERMGLMGIRERAALIGGTLEIESAPNKGTTIFIRFPTPPPD